MLLKRIGKGLDYREIGDKFGIGTSTACMKVKHSKELWDIKAVVCGQSARELTKNVCTQGPSAQFSARVQGLGLVLGHGARARFLARALEKKCVHISAQQESYSGTSARAPSVNKAKVYILSMRLGGILPKKWVGVCGLLPKILTQFMTVAAHTQLP